MANILLVDPAEIARKAMQGVLARGGHRFAAVASVAEAWDFVQRNVAVDLVFLELKLEQAGGLALVEKLRADVLLKPMPVTVYTGAGDRGSVRRAMELKVQNFLVKPYLDGSILAEISKAVADPWRNHHFEEEKSFCKLMGYAPAELHDALEKLRATLESSAPLILEMANGKNVSAVITRVRELSESAETVGAWGVVEVLALLREKAEQGNWPGFLEVCGQLSFAQKLIFAHLHTDIVPPDFITMEERGEAEQAARRALWFNAPAEGRCPVVPWVEIVAQVEALKGCPVIDSAAASFQMSATGHPSSLAPLMDLAEKDPGLSAHLLVAANLHRRNEELDPEPVENPRLCVGLLGEIKLAAMAGGLLTADSRAMNLPPCSWTNFWLFQVGVARMARYTCRYLEYQSLESRAYVAGLLHDIGKLLFLHLHPFGFQAVVDHAQRENLPIAAAEKLFIGGTSRALAAHFAAKHRLLPSYVNVLRWIDEPESATDDAVLVASVSLARDLCRQNRLGWCGERAGAGARSIAETPEWKILSRAIFPSFNLEKFEAEAHAECREIKMELMGKLPAARL
jgi:CheY-like chemotaxis protein/HD-like signal output (HDOD) protein